MLEVLLGLFGLYGFGWMYAGNIIAGLLLTLGGLVWDVVVLTLVLSTGGFAGLCTAPISIFVMIISALLLSGYTSDKKEFI
jgi:hypothetical protein